MISPLKKFFLTCSGADLTILEKPECAIEHNKYVGIGATILSTSVMAFTSGGYALYTSFNSYVLSFGLGLVWGAIIFNLDRYIVSTIRKRRPPTGATYWQRAAVKLKEYGTALPRLLLAIFISIVITKPIELRLFKNEINKQIDKAAIKQETESKGEIEKKHSAEIEALNAENKRLRQEITDRKREREEAFKLSMAEAIGESGPVTSGRIGKGPVYRERLEEFQKAEERLNETVKKSEAAIAANQQKIDTLKGEDANRLGQTVKTLNEPGDMLARLKALGELSEQNQTVETASLFLIILFALLETSPIIVKLLSERGPYDEIYETLEHQVYAGEQKKILEINDEVSAGWWLRAEISARKLAAEMQLTRRTMDSLETLAAVEVTEAQMEVAQQIVSQWKQKVEMPRFAAAPSPFSRNGDGHSPDPSIVQVAQPTRPSEPEVVSTIPEPETQLQADGAPEQSI
jgi:hypothetical protein